jgi:hypothetical protein
VIATLVIGAAIPAGASAHGPVAPVATSYKARITGIPAGLEAKVVDGYVRMWLRAPAGDSVVVLDYRGAPYLRFTPAGVQVNQNSTMYYLNLTPVAATPPADLNRDTPPNWQAAGSGHDYEWHDGRLQALASVAIAPGVRYLGRWSIPLLVNGRPATISGGLYHAPNPSIVWFWPIVVLLLCVLAGWRVRRAALDARMARTLAVTALVSLAIAAIGQGLHGRPSVTGFQVAELVLVLAFAVWGLRKVLLGRPGYFSFFLIAFVAVWEGVELFPTLRHGFVLIELPAFLARTAAVLCLGCGAAMLLLVFRLADLAGPEPDIADELDDDPGALEQVYDLG